MPKAAVKSESVEEKMETEDAKINEVEEDLDDEENPEDWEEVTMVVTVNGILDADIVRDAVKKDLIKLRYAETDSPVLQVNNSLYTGTWNQDLGTNVILQSTGKEMEVISCTSTMLTGEKALLTSISSVEPSIAATADSAPKNALTRTQPRGK